MAYVRHVKSGLDFYLDSTAIQAICDALYLKLDTSNDPLTGELVITPSSGNNALKANKRIVMKAGERLIWDGA